MWRREGDMTILMTSVNVNNYKTSVIQGTERESIHDKKCNSVKVNFYTLKCIGQ